MMLRAWYLDPAGAGVRFWDGVQWTAATAGPVVVMVPVIAGATAHGWAQRHPLGAVLAAFWAACVVWLCPGLVPVLAVTVAGVWGVRWTRQRRMRG